MTTEIVVKSVSALKLTKMTCLVFSWPIAARLKIPISNNSLLNLAKRFALLYILNCPMHLKTKSYFPTALGFVVMLLRSLSGCSHTISVLSVCTYNTNVKSNLKRHMKIHRGNIPQSSTPIKPSTSTASEQPVPVEPSTSTYTHTA